MNRGHPSSRKMRERASGPCLDPVANIPIVGQGCQHRVEVVTQSDLRSRGAPTYFSQGRKSLEFDDRPHKPRQGRHTNADVGAI